jgi:hypothetical protein
MATAARPTAARDRSSSSGARTPEMPLIERFDAALLLRERREHAASRA